MLRERGLLIDAGTVTDLGPGAALWTAAGARAARDAQIAVLASGSTEPLLRALRGACPGGISVGTEARVDPSSATSATSAWVPTVCPVATSSSPTAIGWSGR